MDKEYIFFLVLAIIALLISFELGYDNGYEACNVCLVEHNGIIYEGLIEDNYCVVQNNEMKFNKFNYSRNLNEMG